VFNSHSFYKCIGKYIYKMNGYIVLGVMFQQNSKSTLVFFMFVCRCFVCVNHLLLISQTVPDDVESMFI